MDCRWIICSAAALLVAAGCEHFPLLGPQDEKTKAEKEREARCVWIEQTKLKPETLVAFGDLNAQGALDPASPASEKERRTEKARDAYEPALKEDPNHLPAYLALAHLFESTGRHDRAVETYQAALQKHPKAKEVWFELGYKIHAPHKEWEQAIECMRKAVELDPDNVPYTKTLGMTLARCGRYEESFSRLRPIVGEAEAHSTIAKMLHHLGQDAAARQHAELALQVDPNLRSAKELMEQINNPPPTPETMAADVDPQAGSQP